MKWIPNETNEINETLKAMESIYSPKYGLANRLITSDLDHKIVSLRQKNYKISNVIPMYNTFVENSHFSSWTGAGSALSLEKSKVKAFGEFIERYCSSNIRNDHDVKIIFDSYDNLKNTNECLDLNELIHFEDYLYNNNDFPFCKCFNNTKISWVMGKNLVSGMNTYLPAQKVFLGIKLLNGEQYHIVWLSTGLACGKNYLQASISAIYEVIERDSFMLTWLLKLSGVRINIDSIQNIELQTLYNHICKYLVGEDQLYIYNISRTEGIYTVLTYIRNDNPDSFGLIVSSASHINAEIALIKSLEELCLTQSFACSRLHEDERRLCQAFTENDVTDLHKHTLYYSTGKRSHEIDFISTSNEYVNLSQMKEFFCGSEEEILDYLVNVFRINNQSVYIADITRKEILNCGFSVVRAIISGYNDLDYSHKYRQLKNRRLQEYQKKFDAQLNCAPHPFP